MWPNYLHKKHLNYCHVKKRHVYSKWHHCRSPAEADWIVMKQMIGWTSFNIRRCLRRPQCLQHVWGLLNMSALCDRPQSRARDSVRRAHNSLGHVALCDGPTTVWGTWLCATGPQQFGARGSVRRAHNSLGHVALCDGPTTVCGTSLCATGPQQFGACGSLRCELWSIAPLCRRSHETDSVGQRLVDLTGWRVFAADLTSLSTRLWLMLLHDSN